MNSVMHRRFQASSSEMFGSSEAEVQNEETPFKPCSPYGNKRPCQKLYWAEVLFIG